MRRKMIPIFWPSYSGKKIQREMRKLFPKNCSNRWLGEGPKTKEFEKKFGEKYNYKYCLSTSSGSAALELAYHLLDLKPGDEVIYPVLTCTATGIPLLRRGVKLVFIDIDKDTFTPSYDDMIQKITKKTKAIVVVTLGGSPVDKRIFILAKKLNIPVVVDACQSLGSTEKYGDYVCYSLQAIKTITAGDGGILILRNQKDYDRARKLRWFGIDREAKARNNWQPYKNRKMIMDIEEPGYKFHMNDISAAIGLCGLSCIDKYLAHRKKIAEIYQNIDCPKITGGTHWLFGLVVENRDEFARAMSDAGIETNVVHLRNDIFRVFGGKRQKLSVMNDVENKYVYLPIHTHMSLKDAEYIVKTINKFLSVNHD